MSQLFAAIRLLSHNRFDQPLLILGQDARLVVPCPGEPLVAYGHLAAFARCAPTVQQHALWQQVGTAMQQRLNQKPVWLSTAGAGVAWLHVRLDDRPKYYGYATYRMFA